ncbi:hypothetical protein NAK13_004258 [Escherichia coli]|nr:hypothetical protein [Escherichia coli]EJG7147544.1 hypothetical protein [Escherichia coli]
MSEKYELVKEYTRPDPVFAGEYTLYRIRALQDIPRHNVKAGDPGGWVESEHNLSQDGDAWVAGDACVMGDARVYGNALVRDRACITSGGSVYGNAVVSGVLEICNDVEVCGNAHVSGSSDNDVLSAGDSRLIISKGCIKGPFCIVYSTDILVIDSVVIRHIAEEPRTFTAYFRYFEQYKTDSDIMICHGDYLDTLSGLDAVGDADTKALAAFVRSYMRSLVPD